jgi:hypothetical protein
MEELISLINIINNDPNYTQMRFIQSNYDTYDRLIEMYEDAEEIKNAKKD